MAFAPYATLPEFKAWITLTDTIDDVVMSDCLDTATSWIDEYCDRHFWKDGGTGTEVARTFASNCGWDIAIDDLVPGSLTTFKTDASGDGTFETTWAASDYEMGPVNRPTGRPFTQVEAIAGRPFPVRLGRSGRKNRIEITGVWGWAAVPHPVRQACLELASRELDRRRSPQGVAGFSDFGAVRISMFDPDMERNLKPYRHSRTTVLVA